MKGTKIGLLIGIVLFIFGAFRFFTGTQDFGKSLPKNFPKDIPVVTGDIVSSKSGRSDELKRSVDLRIHTREEFKNVVEFYKSEFKKSATRELNQPNFSTSDYLGKEASGIAEFGTNQVVVSIKDMDNYTEVWIQVLGNSIFSLPK